MVESNKEIHIVFQVLNFIFGALSHPYNLSPDEKILLIALARHKGAKGIYPSITTLAKELKRSRRSIMRYLKVLNEKQLINIDKNLGCSNRYKLSPTSVNCVTGDVHVTSDTPVTGLVTTEVTTSDTPVTQSIKINNKKEIIERARKKRAALSDSFLPNEKIIPLWQETVSKSGKTKDQLLSKFKNLQKSKDGMSADWDAEFENFLLNERPMGYSGSKPTPELKCTIPEFGKPGHPDYERNKEFEMRYAAERKKQIELTEAPLPENILSGEEFVQKAREYQRKKLNGQSQHGELNHDITSLIGTGNNSRR